MPGTEKGYRLVNPKIRESSRMGIKVATITQCARASHSNPAPSAIKS